MVPIHPLIVHFPVALLVVSCILYTYSFLTGKENFWNFALVIHLAGLSAAVIAVLTGNSEGNDLLHTKGLQEMVILHQKLGLISAWAFGMMAAWSFLRRDTKHKLEKGIFCLAFLSLSGLLVFDAHLGGRMVFEKGAGVAPMEKVLKEQFRQEQN